MSEDTSLWHCDECNLDFKNQAGLLSHLKTHAKLPPVPGELPVNPPPPVNEILQPGVASTGAFNLNSGESFTIPTGTPSVVPTGFVTMSTAGWPSSDLTVKVKRLPHFAGLPDIKRATLGSAGFDLYAAIPDVVTIRINAWQLIPTGLAFEIPYGWVGLVAPRSGLAANNGITVLNTPGIIDADYRGELKVNLVNNTTSKFLVHPGMRIAQILFTRSPTVNLEFVEELSQTIRGEGGFGSTGA
jgi:dUTP pyrophosphatase